MAHAYCWRDGTILIGPRVPHGALPLARARENRLRQVVSVVARHAYDGTTMLVPGIPEAGNAARALEAAEAFRAQLRKRLAPRRRRTGRLV